jgi:hypothetical protein
MTSPAWLERARANVRAAAEGREEPPPLPCVCPECGAAFSKPARLRSHQIKHRKAERPGRSP